MKDYSTCSLPLTKISQEGKKAIFEVTSEKEDEAIYALQNWFDVYCDDEWFVMECTKLAENKWRMECENIS
jgi:hypothetical protein